MTALLDKLATVRRYSLSQKVLLLEASTMLVIARAAVVVLPFRWVSRVFGVSRAESKAQPSSSQMVAVRRVAVMVRRTARNLPLGCRCLERTLAISLMLRWRCIPATVYIGVRNGKQGDLEAHAWLRSGDLFASGGENHRQFTVIHQFASKGG